MAHSADTVAAVLLCGGASERLGFAKEMLRVDGAPLAVHMVRRLKCLFSDVSVSSNNPGYLRHLLDVPVFEDEVRQLGERGEECPLAGIWSGLRHSAGEKVLFLACDMPLVRDDMIRALVARAQDCPAEAVIARGNGRTLPLFGVYSRSLLPGLERALATAEDLSVQGFLETVTVEHVNFTGPDARRLRDVDAAADLGLLREAFREVEPLPVKVTAMTRRGRAAIACDVVVEEWPIAIRANGISLATVMCMPAALRELALGFAACLGLVERREQVRSVHVDYDAKRVALELDAAEKRIRDAVQLPAMSACAANMRGSGVSEARAAGEGRGFRVRRSHILECLHGLRQMAPVFARTGCTHQAGFSDGRAIRHFYEDIGRRNAVDKVVGAALMADSDLSAGALVTTGRLNTEMVVRALRGRAAVLASRSAVTSNAVRLAERHGLTLVGFARGGRVNVYAGPERVTDG